GNTSGIVTATVSSDTASNLNTNLSNASASDSLTLTISGVSATAVDINALDGKTSVNVDASSLTDITGSLSDLNTIYDSNGITGLGDENVSISDTGTITASNMNDFLSPLETSGTITLNGSGNLNITLGTGENLDLSGVSNSLSGSLTIVDSSGGNTITGTSVGETVETTVSNLTASDSIDGAGGNDTLSFTNSGSIDSDDIVDGISNFETLNLSNGNDTINFDDTIDFNNFIGEFGTISDAGGTDSLSFGSSAVSGDLDFSKLGNFENLNLSSVADTITLSGDESTNINGLGGDDNFTLDFTNIDDFTIDGGSGTSDTVDLNGTSNSIAADEEFGHALSFTNIENLDISGLNLVTADGDTEFEFTDALIKSWTGETNGNLTLSLTSTQVDLIKFTDTISGTERNEYDTVTTTTSIEDNTTYDLGDSTLTIDLIDV
ncbi:hypothetical protein, partial [Arcobacter sp. LA11]|uniref:beta strand repeat-containing protein n=1 Tax=Arcobacter sp. LA11 TaxID=1898176 RepID=UPI002159C565